MSDSNIVLASASPRRQEILSLFNKDIKIIPSQISESILPNEPAISYVTRVAEHKAQDIALKCPDSFVIGADTIVLYKDNILGKPIDTNDARRMLEMLSGNWHEVLTAIAIINTTNQKKAVEVCKTRVKFSPLTSSEIDWYIASNEPFDKAGAYAIQGYGSIFVEEIAGNYLNVVGLPITLLRKLLQEVGGKLI